MNGICGLAPGENRGRVVDLKDMRVREIFAKRRDYLSVGKSKLASEARGCASPLSGPLAMARV